MSTKFSDGPHFQDLNYVLSPFELWATQYYFKVGREVMETTGRLGLGPTMVSKGLLKSTMAIVTYFWTDLQLEVPRSLSLPLANYSLEKLRNFEDKGQSKMWKEYCREWKLSWKKKGRRESRNLLRWGIRCQDTFCTDQHHLLKTNSPFNPIGRGQRVHKRQKAAFI